MTLELNLEGGFPVELGQVFQTERDEHAGPHGRRGQAVVQGQRNRKGEWGWRPAMWRSGHGFDSSESRSTVILLSASTGLLQSA